MVSKIFHFIFSFGIALIFVCCSEYQKLLNNDDASKKYRSAEEYYKKGEFRKANRLIEQIIPKYRGKPQAERIIFFFADSYFKTKNYILSSYQYENFIKSYPKSQRIEEAQFRLAQCYYFLSPEYSLDQEDTYTAIDKLQIFINLYPTSEYAEEANQMILELQTKLEQKDFEIAKGYHTIRDYSAAIKSQDNFISSFPGTKFREQALYVKFVSAYEIAINSVLTKKQARLEELEQQYATILRYYPETFFIEELDRKMEEVNKEFNLLAQNQIN